MKSIRFRKLREHDGTLRGLWAKKKLEYQLKFKNK